MEVVTATPGSGGVPPFHDHDVREWSRLDSLTGVLERARLETDNWTATTGLASHKYGKVVDSRARTNADGGLQQQARRQLEVFHSQVPGGQFQVIKTHTVSSSRWSGASSNGHQIPDFENLQLAVNPLDVSSQKSKASVGRSFGRRPPTRSRLISDGFVEDLPPHVFMTNPHLTAAHNLHRVSRLCHQIHETAVKQAFGKFSDRLPIRERQNGDGSVEIHEIESASSGSTTGRPATLNGHSNLTRTKSTSSEELFPSDLEKCSRGDDALDQDWKRSSKLRRSLQHPRQSRSPPTRLTDLPENSGSVKKIRENLENGQTLNNGLTNNNVDLASLDQILQSISSSSSIQSDNVSFSGDHNNEIDRHQVVPKKEKRNSFVTVESIQEIRNRLRRTSSAASDMYNTKGEEEADDGLGSEENNLQLSTARKTQEPSPTQNNRVRSYVFGMETMLNKKTFNGTGSLESKSKLLTTNTTSRSEDWYNRRKSYGFENVHNQQENPTSPLTQSRKQVESSTDSGICRSSEIFAVPTKTSVTSENCNGDISNSIEDKYSSYDLNKDSKSLKNVKKMTSLFDRGDSFHSKNQQDELTSVWNRVVSNRNEWEKNNIKSTTITIPVGPLHASSWNSDPEKDIKRHSIAVDESKYVTRNNDNNFRRTSLAINTSTNEIMDDENSINSKRNRRVEFCKTEVHFAAESGKVNIVETDGKPPPTNNFRRRRRNSGSMCPLPGDFTGSGVALLHFGDTSYEKSLLTSSSSISNKENIPESNGPVEINSSNCETDETVYENLKPRSMVPDPVVTVNTNKLNLDYQADGRRDNNENENRKGILKNKPIKPKPYHLGEYEMPFSTSSDDDNRKWGVKLKPVVKEDPPIWKSTVTVQNTLFDRQTDNEINDDFRQQAHKGNGESKNETEFQKLLKNLKPTNIRPSESLSDPDYRENVSLDALSSMEKDCRRSSWSVADKGKFPPDTQWTENKGYSTKVNFGNGEATVVENNLRAAAEKDRHPTWPRSDDYYKEKKQILNKGLVVRIGRDNTASTHKICSKTSMDEDTKNSTTTTKITIDLSPSPALRDIDKEHMFKIAKYQRSQSHSFKSTSLILDTIRNREEPTSMQEPTKIINEPAITLNKKDIEEPHKVIEFKEKNGVSVHLETLKKLYDEARTESIHRQKAPKKPFDPMNGRTQVKQDLEHNSSFNKQMKYLRKICEVPQTADCDTPNVFANNFDQRSAKDDSRSHQHLRSQRKSIPSQLESLKKMYEEAQSDSDADKEVQRLMSKSGEKSDIEDEKSSVVSGSWSKMRAFKAFNQMKTSRGNRETTKLIVQLDEGEKHQSSDTYTKTTREKSPRVASLSEFESKLGDNQYSSQPRNRLSPSISRKVHQKQDKQPRAVNSQPLSSPSLVGSSNTFDTHKYENIKRVSRVPNSPSPIRKLSPPEEFTTFGDVKSQAKHTAYGRVSPTKDIKSVNDSIVQQKNAAKDTLSPSKEFRTLNNSKVQSKCINSHKVLRQPKQSEMTYFGVNVSPKPSKKVVSEATVRKEDNLAEKSDILQHHKSSMEFSSVKQRSRNTSPMKVKKKPESPVYENIDTIRQSNYKKEFDSAILEELTKAADQILQAVKDYTDEDVHNRFSTDDDNKPKKKPLATISETTALKQKHKSKSKTTTTESKSRSRLKATSSNSSIESVSRENTKVMTSTPRSRLDKENADINSRRKSSASVSTNKAQARMRRLQRATSREALLQSHGSSSEDMTATVEVPLRKPRLVRKTKTAQLTITNGPEIKKKETSVNVSERSRTEKIRPSERIVGKLPEITHKTAVSTIRSTAEKANRERSKERASKSKGDEIKRRTPQKKENSKHSGASGKGGERLKTVPSKEAHSHRTSTANIKKCQRAEGFSRH